MGDIPPGRTLAARLEDRDRGRFVGRASELAFLTRCLDGDPPASVVFVSGPGGIGKSTLLREVARRAREQGRAVISYDGRELGSAPEVVEAGLRAAAAAERPVVLLDSYERMAAIDGYLRRDLLPSLPDQALVLIAGRASPDPAWFTGGWEAMTARLDLAGLAPNDAADLLAALGLADERVPAIVDWAGGSPLALALAAEAARADPAWNAATEPDRPEILRSLIHRLAETELRDVRLSALGVAVVARTTTADLLRAVLSRDDADTAYQQLCELTCTEQLGDGITIHELVRKALHADLRQRNPDLERDLRRRVFDYLFTAAQGGDLLLVIEMAHLVENPFIRWGFGLDSGTSYRVDSVREDDATRLEAQFTAKQNLAWWRLSRRFFDHAPDRVAVVRDLNNQISGYMVSMSLATAPRFAQDDPLVGPWLEHARRHAAQGTSVLWQAATDLTGQGKVQAMLGMAGVLRSGTANPRFAYLPIDPYYAGAIEFASSVGAHHVPELDVEIGGKPVECHRLDYGPGGLLAFVRAMVYGELGLPVPEPAAAASPRRPVADLETVRDALKNFRVPRELARSPLAAGATTTERAESVRQLIRAAERQAFGDSETEKLLRNVLTLGYLEPARSHEDAASRLCLSRAAYFRRLRVAVARLAEYLADEQAASSAD